MNDSLNWHSAPSNSDRTGNTSGTLMPAPLSPVPATAGVSIPLVAPAVTKPSAAQVSAEAAAWTVFNETGPRGDVPTSPEGYNLHSLGQFGAEDRPLIDHAAREAHAAGVPQRIFQAGMRAALRAGSWEAVENAIIDAGGRNADCDLAIKILRAVAQGGESNLPRPSADAARLEEIRTIMRTDNRAYWKNFAMQDEYRRLLAKNGN